MSPDLQEEMKNIENYKHLDKHRASLVTQMVKNLPAVQETQVRSLGWKYPLEKGMDSGILALPGELHGQRSLMGYNPGGHKESDTTE